MGLPLSLGEQIIQHGIENEQRIKQDAIVVLTHFYQNTPASVFAEKFRKGALEHGELTENVLVGSAWTPHFLDEAQDAFWYMAMMDFLSARAEEAGR